MTTLLERAKAAGKTHQYGNLTSEHIELALAWVRGEVGIVQVARALGKNINNTSISYAIIARALKAHLQKEV